MSFLFRPRRPSPPPSPPGSGGKIVLARRRPPPPPYARPEGFARVRSAGWLSGLLSGAGRIISSTFRSNDNSPSGSEIDSEEYSDDESGYGDGDDGYSHLQKELPLLTQGGESSRQINSISEEAQAMVPISETKLSIQKLLMQETFSRDECDRLKMLIETRVVDPPSAAYLGRDTSEINAGKTVGSFGLWRPLSQHTELLRLTSGSLTNMGAFSSKSPQDRTPDLRNAAVMEAKKWLEEKKMTSPSMSDLSCGPVSLNTDILLYDVEDNSPADLAKSYMRSEPPWQSPAISSSDLMSPPSSVMSLYRKESPYEATSSLPSFKVFKRKYLSKRLSESAIDARRLRSRPIDVTIEPKLGKNDLPETLFQSNTSKIPSAADESETKFSAINLNSTSLPALETSNASLEFCEELHSKDQDTEAHRLPGCTSVNLIDSTKKDLGQFPQTRKEDNGDSHLRTLTHTSKSVEHDGNYLPEVKAAISEDIVPTRQNNADGSSRPTNDNSRPTNDTENCVGRSVPDDTLMPNNSEGQSLDSETKSQDARPPLKDKKNGSVIESSVNNSAAESNLVSDYGMDNPHNTGSENGKLNPCTSEGPGEQPAENETETPVDLDAEAAPVSSKQGRGRGRLKRMVTRSSPRTSTLTRQVVAKAKPGRGMKKRAI